jgi:excisionase family DNA binding protein
MNELISQPYPGVGTTPQSVQATVSAPQDREETYETQRKLLLTVGEAARALSIGRPKMYELIMRGIVLSVKIGASRRIPTAALEAYVEQLSTDAARTAEGREDYGE